MAGETLEMTDAPVVEPAAAPAEETAEEIEARLQRTQQAIAGKLDVLEEQTLGSIRDTIGAVSDTVNTVQNVVADPVGAMQDAMQSAVLNPLGDVTEGVKETMTNLVRDFVPVDVIRRHPLESVGVATLGGVALGLLLFSRPRVAVPGAPPTMFGSLLNTIGAEVSAIGRELLGSVSQTLVERVKTAVSMPPN